MVGNSGGKIIFCLQICVEKGSGSCFSFLYYELKDKTSAFYHHENGEKTQKLFISKQQQFLVK